MDESDPRPIRRWSLLLGGFAIVAIGAVVARDRAAAQFTKLGTAVDALGVFLKVEQSWTERDAGCRRSEAALERRPEWRELVDKMGGTPKLTIKEVPEFERGLTLTAIADAATKSFALPSLGGADGTELCADVEGLAHLVSPAPSIEFAVSIERRPAPVADRRESDWSLNVVAKPTTRDDFERMNLQFPHADAWSGKGRWKTADGRFETTRTIGSVKVVGSDVWLTDRKGIADSSSPDVVLPWKPDRDDTSWIWKQVTDEPSSTALETLETMKHRREQVLEAVVLLGHVLPVLAVGLILLLLREAAVLVAKVRGWSDRIEGSLSSVFGWSWAAVAFATVTVILPILLALRRHDSDPKAAATAWATETAVVGVFALLLAWMNLRLRSALRKNRREA